MASLEHTTTLAASPTTKMSIIKESAAFDRIAILLSTWLIGGLYLDNWAHIHIAQIETFFTPWHAVLYSGYAANGLFLLLALLRNHQRGYAWQHALPPGYLTALVGAVIFGIGGVLDLLWHLINGIERNIQALLSPTHLILALGIFLIITGPLRAAFARRPAPTTFLDLLPPLLSLTYVAALLTLFTQFADPVVKSRADQFGGESLQALGIASILLQTDLIMGAVLIAMRHWRLPFGTYMLIFGIHGLLTSFLVEKVNVLNVTLLSALAGVLIDLLYQALKPTMTQPIRVRIFAFAAPVTYYLLYFPGVALAHRGLAWPINLIWGSIFMAGAIGLLLSFVLLVPKAEP